MRKIERLRIEALASCNARGHIMSRFESWDDGSKVSQCRFCKCAVWIDPSPLPNETEIMGKAVAVDCEYK